MQNDLAIRWRGNNMDPKKHACMMRIEIKITKIVITVNDSQLINRIVSQLILAIVDN